MRSLLITTMLAFAGALPKTVIAAEPAWPGDAKFAVSLSYDDALASQLDNAVPVLDRLGLHASFYVFANSDSFAPNLSRWRELPQQGHELGNHTLYHVCTGGGPERSWVQPYADLRTRSVDGMRRELMIANTLLQALDGQTERTFTIPCGDVQASDGDYVTASRDLFVAIKGQGLADGTEVLYTPSDLSGAQLIDLVKSAQPSAKVISVLFHGVGGDHLSVSTEAHTEFLEYLAAHPELYWVDTYINIMRRLERQRPD